LRYAHVKAKLAHGDVKPENVLVSRETGAVALCDFDLARALPDEDDVLEAFGFEKKKGGKASFGF
jgi:serine/threonine protein kinase